MDSFLVDQLLDPPAPHLDAERIAAKAALDTISPHILPPTGLVAQYIVEIYEDDVARASAEAAMMTMPVVSAFLDLKGDGDDSIPMKRRIHFTPVGLEGCGIADPERFLGRLAELEAKEGLTAQGALALLANEHVGLNGDNHGHAGLVMHEVMSGSILVDHRSILPGNSAQRYFRDPYETLHFATCNHRTVDGEYIFQGLDEQMRLLYLLTAHKKPGTSERLAPHAMHSFCPVPQSYREDRDVPYGPTMTYHVQIGEFEGSRWVDDPELAFERKGLIGGNFNDAAGRLEELEEAGKGIVASTMIAHAPGFDTEVSQPPATLNPIYAGETLAQAYISARKMLDLAV